MLLNENLFGFSPEAKAKLYENWNLQLEAVEEVKGKESFGDVDKMVLAVCLENTNNELKRAARAMNLGETTQVSDIGGFKKYAFDIITGVMPNLIANELVSVQPLKQKLGQIFYLKYVYGSNKGNVSAGETMFDPYNVGNNSKNYTSETVEEEPLGNSGLTGSTPGNLAYYPVRAGSVTITTSASATQKVITDDGNGNLVGDYTGTINYATGAYTIEFGADTTDDVCTSTYDYDMETVPAQTPEMNLKVTETIVTARLRKLKALFSFHAQYDIEMQHGIDISAQVKEAASQQLRHEIDKEILDDLLTQAALTSTWNKKTPDGIQAYYHKDTFVDELTAAKNRVFHTTKRAVANFIVCGEDASNTIESLPKDKFTPASPGDIAGPHFAGTLSNGLKVYKNPFYAADRYVLGYKGKLFLDAGYVYAPYLPIFATQLLMMEDFVGRQGYATSYAKKMLNANFYVKGTITNT